MDNLQEMLFGYVNDMRAYIAPQNGYAQMRVDRNDIWYNIMQIQSVVEIAQHGLAFPQQSVEDYRNIPVGLSADAAEEMQRRIEEESERRQRNYQKLDTFRSTSMGARYRPFEDALDEIWRIYNNSIKEFENRDDIYSYRAVLYYDNWRTLGDRIGDLGNALESAGRGFMNGFESLVDGVKRLPDGLLSLCAFLLFSDWLWGATYDMIELPDGARERADAVENKILAMSDVGAVVDAIGQSMMDTYEEIAVCILKRLLKESIILIGAD